MNSRLGLATSRTWLLLGMLFLYLPIFTLVTLSFNDNKSVTLWTTFSFRWYGELLNDTQLIDGFLLSLRIALLTATSSVVLGAFAAFALVKYTRFFGRTAFNGMVSAPLVMPDVIIGLALLLMLVSLEKQFGFPERGLMTDRKSVV